MAGLNLNLNYSGIQDSQLNNMKEMVRAAQQLLENGAGAGSDFTGWVHLPQTFDMALMDQVEACAARLKEKCDVLVVVGIGGSYLGTRAVSEALKDPMEPLRRFCSRENPTIIYAGHHLEERYMEQLLGAIDELEVCVNVISKSGTTTEPAIAFRMLKSYMEKRYGVDGAKERIVATTDKARGALRTLADEKGYETFVIEDDIGGRYSVLTPVGLLPLAVSGVDIRALMEGAKAAYEEYLNPELETNNCFKYAAARTILQDQGKVVEILANYNPALQYISEWWKQLYGESEGKDGRGIFPASVQFSSDLHSMGQYIQDGRRMIFETVLLETDQNGSLKVNEDGQNLDGLNFLAGKSLKEINFKAFEGTLLAHVAGGTPNLVIELEKIDAYHIGQLLYFFMKACGISGYLLGVNPFDQPGVEAYKKNMFALLGKPGYEAHRQTLEAALKRL
ncbi:glucose-6-phosphate isomerase [Acidaminobacter sp.]|uniref:glucose-6-phosphate isomerase n=1 Tax=Acidaminobacter sp. TaxID=1872102 RepID=UPI00137FC2A4|nr:glucose-6-phosphate isomerase [Acidaminobacter sp.]MDK9710525.1 glucose-6-phosphate isomerase [Acidaminobacter sp.]MZQ98179.1 glucose-6-phosphate isomerase [Acidaminobacter sp.]